MPSPVSQEWIRRQILAIQQTDPATPSACTEPLEGFFAAVSPHLDYPRWLGPFCDVLAQAEEEPVKVVVSVPPQHGKSTLLLHWLCRHIGRRPGLNHAYCAYAGSLAERQSRNARRIATDAGVRVDGTIVDWQLPAGGACAWTSIGGPLTGKPISGVGIIDDPHKDRADAESAAMRERAWDWYRDTFLSRLHPGSSQIVCATRWVQDDLSGRLLDSDPSWVLVNLPAIDDAGMPLWPEGRPLEWLEERRAAVGEYGWSSMYMGAPRPRGSSVFETGATCRLVDVPQVGEVTIGIDLAYTSRSRADYTSLVVLRSAGGRHYVIDVVRSQMSPADSLDLIRRVSDRYRAPLHWHTTGIEARAGELIASHGIPLRTHRAEADKYLRSQPVASAWNAGQIVTPIDAPWSPAFLSEVRNFSGLDNQTDDQVDALVSAYLATRSRGRSPVVVGDRSFAAAPKRRIKWAH